MHAWNCQFEKPTSKALLAQLDPDAQALYQVLRKAVTESIGIKPKLEWMGLTWQWCDCFVLEAGGTLIAVHLIPDPDNPRAALTLSTAFFESTSPSSLPKVLHPGLSTATTIGHQTWCEWSLSSEEIVESITQLLEVTQGR